MINFSLGTFYFEPIKSWGLIFEKSRRGRGRRGTRGGYMESSGRGRGRGRGNYTQGKFEKNPNYNLQEKLKDDFF
jgi:hypothetical protein